MSELDVLRLVDVRERLLPIGDRIFAKDVINIRPHSPYLNLLALIEPQTRFFRTYIDPFAEFTVDRARVGDKDNFPQPITGENEAFILDCGRQFVESEAGRLAVEACRGEFDTWLQENSADGQIDIRQLLTAAKITPQYLHPQYEGVTMPWNEGESGLVAVSDLGEYMDMHFPQAGND